ncbi:MAG: hypothetical protein A2860_00145 [Candidatus Levybacteria bacterium RIFCSPHIGHO2_01_FULL_37_33]|nr:MAG: hypothetical protein A2860_00145 [Candidatus Levybacteria bacterium RIFCSPHIGHO2_01_FULL_37_33]OGH17409.1 MAG: hypothetical protein A3C97_01490 [Candidatus Levybacteria bacterium RIFCSPHIGHO2_02_FULL_37_11]OGH29185.1 MAG: hypothetical protein A3F30_04275 [Candidatus Levybacteria bacterium RIFCSPHIGHO2_12_FULL_37_12]OGH33215.1 MAG: hypothetical protein A2953_03055 [Candidatus Levybacteria bacterium RIFCSPLOWO2_01_FULL_36_54]
MDKRIEWVLRIAVAGEFLGHGVLALEGKKQWVGWISQLTTADTGLATQLLFLIGLSDLIVALFVLLKPVRIILVWAVFWGFWTAILRPIVGEAIWDFIERFANFGAPLALLLIKGSPKNLRDLFR